MALTFAIRFPAIVFSCFETGNWKMQQIVREISVVPFRKEKEVVCNFENGFLEKLEFHLTLNRNFGMLLLVSIQDYQMLL